MELLNYPKTDYLIDSSLELLHAQSVEWLNVLAFWADEMTFFYHLLHHKQLAKALPASQVAEIEKELVKLNGEELDRVRAGVRSHERLLAAVYKSNSKADDQVYRESHMKLHDEMGMLRRAVITFKRSLFAFIQDHQ